MILTEERWQERVSLVVLAPRGQGGLLMQALESLGHPAHPCHDVDAAAEVALSGSVGAALVLSEDDPDPALRFCRKLSAANCDMSIIVLLPPSLEVETAIRIKLLEAGADFCLATTVSVRELSARLLSQLRLDQRSGQRQSISSGFRWLY